MSKEDGFKVDFPGTPKVTQTQWKTEQGYASSRIYSAERGRERYSLTVVDYSGIEQMGIARNKACPSGAETCQGPDDRRPSSLIGPGYAIQDIRAAMTYAAFKFIQRDAKVTAHVWNWQDLVEGFELHLTNNADESRTMATSRCTRTSSTCWKGRPGLPGARAVLPVDGVRGQGRKRHPIRGALYQSGPRPAARACSSGAPRGARQSAARHSAARERQVGATIGRLTRRER